MKTVDFKTSEAAAIDSGAMEVDTISKNGASSKSLTSRGNVIINMLNRKFISVLLVAVLTAGYAQGQGAGPQVGVNYTNKSLNTSINGLLQDVKFNMKFKMKPGFQIGGVAETALKSEKIFLQVGFLISSQKCVFDRIEIKSGKLDLIDIIELPDDAILNLTYLRMPIRIMYKKDLGNVTFLAFGGYYLGLAVAGKILDEKIEFGGFMSRYDFGLNLGPGIQFGNVQAAIEYSIGFGLNSESSILRTTINNGFSLNLTYLFGK